MIDIQITLISEMGYKPISTLIKCESWEEYQAHKQHYQQEGVITICAKRYMTIRDLRKYGYTQIRARVYDKEKIQAENRARYEQIKKERGWI